MRTLRDCFIFLLLILVLLFGFLLMDVGSLRNPWTWVFTVVGAAIVETLTYIVYKSKPRKKSSE